MLWKNKFSCILTQLKNLLMILIYIIDIKVNNSNSTNLMIIQKIIIIFYCENREVDGNKTHIS
jgi:hypothetical protein